MKSPKLAWKGWEMAKAPPSFDFYYNDWKGGTDHLTQEEKGCYLDLLIFQWQNGHIPREPLQRMGLCRITDLGSWERIWRHLEDKFECIGEHENTPLLANERMNFDREMAIERWQRCVENAKNNGKKGGRPRETQSVSKNNPLGFKKGSKKNPLRKEEGGSVLDIPLDLDTSFRAQSPILPISAQSSYCAQIENREDLASSIPQNPKNKKTADESFAEFWGAYPIVSRRDGSTVPKGSKADAEKRWSQMSTEDRELAIASLPDLREFLLHFGQCNQHAVTWLNKRGWLTDYAEQVRLEPSIAAGHAKPKAPIDVVALATRGM